LLLVPCLGCLKKFSLIFFQLYALCCLLAADAMLMPVADDPVDASTLNAGFVAPLRPTDKAVAADEAISNESADSSHKQDMLAVAPKNLTSCPESFSPIVNVPAEEIAPPAKARAFALWVIVTSPECQLMTPPLAKNKSENAVPDAPMAPLSFEGAKTLGVVMLVVTAGALNKFAHVTLDVLPLLASFIKIWSPDSGVVMVGKSDTFTSAI